MKTKLLALVALVLVCSLALGCATAVAEYKFGYTCMDGTNPFFVVIEKAMREAVEANGDVLIATDPANDVTLQIQQVEDMITQGIDAIFLNPAEAEGILPALDMLKAAGAPHHPELIKVDMERFRKTHFKAQMIRPRYTVLDILTDLGILDEVVEKLFAPDGFWGQHPHA